MTPQLLVWLNPGVTLTPVRVTAWLPLLINRAAWAGLVVPIACAEKVSLVGVKINEPPFRTPFPVTVIPCDPPALSAIVISSVCSPTVEGSKVTCMLQVPPPPATDVPQVLVCWKSPLEVMLLMLRAALPPLTRVTVTGELGLLMG